ncbi:MAG: hypothetical protein WB559_00465, partial [Candidatus Acidiferrales bacterium]
SSSHRNLDNYDFVRRFLAETPPEQVRPPRLLTGDDLISLGYAPGPPFHAILEAVEEAQLNGKVTTREAALRLVQEMFKPAPHLK